jgi:hypothetical protein
LASDVQEVASKRAPRTKETVAARVQEVLDKLPAPVRSHGVQPLNPGFFQLEAIRAGAGAKERTAQRQQMKGK